MLKKKRRSQIFWREVIKGINSPRTQLSKGQTLSKIQHLSLNQIALSAYAPSYSPGLSGLLVLKLLWHCEQLGNWYARLCLLAWVEEQEGCKERLVWAHFVLGHLGSQRYSSCLKLWVTDPFSFPCSCLFQRKGGKIVVPWLMSFWVLKLCL